MSHLLNDVPTLLYLLAYLRARRPLTEIVQEGEQFRLVNAAVAVDVVLGEEGLEELLEPVLVLRSST